MMYENLPVREITARLSTDREIASERSLTEQPSLDWRLAHEDLSRLAGCRARLDWEEGASLLRALRAGAHLHLGFATFAEYIERIFGYKFRWTEERLRVAEALEGLSEIAQSLRDGAISWSAARELTRVAAPESEHAWLEVARGRTVRQIEELVAGHQPGDAPDDPSDSSLRRQVLRFDVSAETYATFREAMAKLRRDAGSPLDDDASLLLLARRILGGPTDSGRANYQVALTLCEACGRGWQHGRGELVEVGREIVEMARCDAQSLGPVGQGRENARPATHVGARSGRARQDVPPAVRREVMRRDGGRCAVPGCRNAVFLDIHHVVPRSEGGNHDLDGLAVLCAAHHRALHRGQLIVEGRVSTGLVFRHADGSLHGSTVRPRAVATHEAAFRALRALGFREGEARMALERVRRETHLGENASTEEVLRHALTLLAPTSRARAV
jgi:hypothetical protein